MTAEPLKRLWEVAHRPSRTILGLMSGTSLDGIDAALGRISGSGREPQVELLAFETSPFPEAVRERVRQAMTGSVRDVCEVNVLVGEALASAAEALVARASDHMALERQALPAKKNRAEVERVARELMEDMPPDFWTGE